VVQDHDAPVLTLTPPLITTMAQMDTALDILDECLS